MARQLKLKLFTPQSTEQATFFEEIADVDLDTCSIGLCFASLKKDNATADFEKLELSPGLADDFRTVVRNAFAELREDLIDEILRIREYEGTTKLDDHEIEHLELTSQEQIRAQLAPLSALLLLDPFDEDRQFLSDLRFYVIIVQPPIGETIYCFRYYTTRYELHRSWFAALKGNGTGYYDDVDQPGFIFDQNIDCICRGTNMYILNKDKFQRIFQFYEYVKREADVAFGAIRERIPISNMDEFERACRQEVRMAAMLANIGSKPHLERLNIERMKRAIARYDLPIKVVEIEGVEMLEYSPSYKWEFLNLLNDNYLVSHMTDLDYESNSKRPMQAKVKANGREKGN